MRKPRAGNHSVRPLADAVGVTGSVACAMRCLIVPLSLVFGQVAPTSFVDDEVFHSALLWLVIPAATLALSLGCRIHRDRTVLLLGSLGLIALTLALTVLHDLLGESEERVTAIAASMPLIAAHVRNFRLCRNDTCDQEEPCETG